jgi:peptidoglycan/LPS O-acetylase OafA/YrhL
MKTQPGLGHVRALDGLRGIACLSVVLYHAARWTPGISGGSWLYSHMASLGWSGVDLFFVLSGFLITGILVDTKGSLNFFRAFYARRSLRIFPLYYLVLILFLFIPGPLPPAHLSDYSSSWLWFYGFNIKIALRDSWTSPPVYLNHFWTLAVEEQFYLVWPLLVYLTPRRRMATLCWTALLFGMATRYAAAFAGLPTSAFVLTPCRMDSLAAGGLLSLAVRNPSFQPERYRTVASRLVVPCALSIVAIGFVRRSFGSWDPWMQTVGITLLMVLAGALLIVAFTSRPDSFASRLFSTPALTSVGKYSYAIYVFHNPIIAAVGPLLGLPRPSHLYEQLAFAILCALASFLTALVSWHLFEKHFLRLKAIFNYDQPRTIASAETGAV